LHLRKNLDKAVEEEKAPMIKFLTREFQNEAKN